MAEETKQENPPEEKAPEPKQEDKAPEPKQERREDPAPEPEPLVKCPECRVRVDPGDLGSHRYLSHKVERRAGSKREDDGGQDDGKDSPTPKRKGTAQSNESGTQSPAKRKSRWSEVRSGWGG